MALVVYHVMPHVDPASALPVVEDRLSHDSLIVTKKRLDRRYLAITEIDGHRTRVVVDRPLTGDEMRQDVIPDDCEIIAVDGRLPA